MHSTDSTDRAEISNPFAMLLNPEEVLQAVGRSERLERLQRRVCRPLDKPVLQRTPSDLNEFDQFDSDDFDSHE